MSAKNAEEPPKRTTSLHNERFKSNKAMPAPEPPKSDVGMESAKNTKIIRTKHYSHHKHTRHVTEDEKIYETVTTTSRPVKISKTVYTTTKVESGPAKTHQRYFESKVHLVNSEDKSAREMPSNQSVISENRKEAKEVHIHHENGHIKVHGKAHNNESNPDSKRDHKLDHKPESKKDHKLDHKPDHSHENKHEHKHEHKQDLQTPNQALHGSNESIYKTAPNTLAELESVSNFSVKSLQLPAKLLEDNASVRSASANAQFNAEYEKLNEIFTRWQEVRETLNNNSDFLLNIQEELIRQFHRCEQLRQLVGRKTPSVASLALKPPERIQSRGHTPVPSIHKLPVKEDPTLPADPNHNAQPTDHLDKKSIHSKVSVQHRASIHARPKTPVSVRSIQNHHQIEAPVHAAPKTPSVHSLAQIHNQHVVEEPHYEVPIVPTSVPVKADSVHSNVQPPRIVEEHPVDVSHVLSHLWPKTPSVHSLQHKEASHYETPHTPAHSRPASVRSHQKPAQIEAPNVPMHSRPASIRSVQHNINDSTPYEYIPILDQWKPVDTGSLHHAQTLPNQHKNNDYESIKSFQMTGNKAVQHHVEHHKSPSIHSLHKLDAKSIRSTKSVDGQKPHQIEEEVKSERSIKTVRHEPKAPSVHEQVTKAPSIHEDAKSIKSIKSVQERAEKPASVHDDQKSEKDAKHHHESTHHLPVHEDQKSIHSVNAAGKDEPIYEKPHSVHGDEKSERSVKSKKSEHSHNLIKAPVQHSPLIHEDQRSVHSEKHQNEHTIPIQHPITHKDDIKSVRSVASLTHKLPSPHEEDKKSVRSLKAVSEPAHIHPIHEDTKSVHSHKSAKDPIHQHAPFEEDGQSIVSSLFKRPPSAHTVARYPDPDELIHPEPVFFDNTSEHIYQAPNSLFDEHHYETVPLHDDNAHKNGRPQYPAPSVAPLPDLAQLKPPMLPRHPPPAHLPSNLPSIPVVTPSETKSPDWDAVMRDVREVGRKRLSEEE